MEDLPGKVIEELEAYKMEVARIFGLTEDSF